LNRCEIIIIIRVSKMELYKREILDLRSR
jgi:hypothetical protein